MTTGMTRVTARTSLGDIIGEAADGIVRFRTVPYATPPVGDLRFAPPSPLTAWLRSVGPASCFGTRTSR